MQRVPPNLGRPLDPEERQQLILHKLLVKTLRRPPRLIPFLVAGLLAAQLILPLLGHGTDDEPMLPAILAFGHLDGAIRAGQFWRLMASWVLHRDAVHLFGNVVFLVLLGRLVEAAWGPARTWLICIAAGLAGSLLALSAHTPVMIGASGVIIGLCSATLALGLRLWPRLLPPLRGTLVLLPGLFLVWRLLFDHLAGEAAQLNPYAHQGGALAGFVMGLWLDPQLPGDPAGARRWSRRWTRLALALTTFTFAVAIGQALAHLRQPVRLPSIQTQLTTVAGQPVRIPAHVQRGVMRRGHCTGDDTDVDWALKTGRTVCFTLEPFGILLLDRRDHIPTLDAHDYETMRAANQTGRLVQSEPHVMLYPLGKDLLWALEAPEPALRWHASALIPLLPPAGSATVQEPLLLPIPTLEQILSWLPK